ncbi:MAG TPA: L,D-transpeptidase family protein [Stellaceae bacterium]|nr:L,D-transpeptidase family protein [Stellaceae bacterium]
MADLILRRDGMAVFGDRARPCALGRGGRSIDKREGDGATPIGAWPLRRVLYRADRLRRPSTALTVTALEPGDGWCDAPADARYNQPVPLPYPASAETLWRPDSVYDVIVPLGFNDAPIEPGRGSAIFLHVARPDYASTEGCVALALTDLLDYLASAQPGDRVVVEATLTTATL